MPDPTGPVALAVAAFGLSIIALAIAVGVLFIQLAGCR